MLGYHYEEPVATMRLVVPVSSHPVDSVNLKNPNLGIYEQCTELVARHGVTKGRIRLTLAPGERHAGLTVNEYETLLMRHDLSEVLRDPLRFMAEKAGHMLGNPRAIPARTLDYAKYDLVRVFNQFVDMARPARVAGRIGPLARHRHAGRAIPAHEARREPARLRPQGRGHRRDRRRHLPEPDPGAVAPRLRARRGRSTSA